jgi:ABC-type amino acid transport substrate-binding protein
MQRGKLRIGVRSDAPPFGQLNDSQQLTGFDIDLAHEFARRWLGDANAVELVEVTSSDRIPRLATGDVDMLLAAVPLKREREALIDFSQTYFMDGQALLASADAGIDSFDDLDGRTVAVVQGAGYEDAVQQVAEERNVSVGIAVFPEYADAITALTTGQADAITADAVTLNQIGRENPGLQIVGDRLTQEPYGIGAPQNDADFREMVNFTLQDMKLDGVYDGLYQRWFPADKPYNIAISPGEWPYTFETLPAEVTPVEASRIQEILERGLIQAGVRTDQPPFGFQDEDGQLQGLDVDLVRELARRWLGDSNAVEFTPVDPAAPSAGVADGQLDLAAAALVGSRDLAAEIDFSQPYLGPPAVEEPYAIGLPQNDSAFRELVNATLQEMTTDGAYQALYSRWFTDNGETYAIEVAPGSADYLLASLSDQVGEQKQAPRITAQGESIIQRIRNRNNLMIAGVKYDFKPFGFTNEQGEAVGFDLDLMEAIAREWGVNVQFVPVTSSDRIQKLVAGEVDIVAASMTHTKGRDETIDFSQTYFLDGQSLLVRRDSGIEDIFGLEGKTVAAIQGSTSIDQIRAHADSNGVSIDILPFQEYPQALEALNAGQVAALTTDSVALSQFAKDNPNLVVVGGLFTQEPYGLGLPSGDSYFNNLVNFTLQKLKEDGVYDQIYHKWFGEESTPYDVEIQPGEWPYTFADSPVALDRPVQSKVDEIMAKGKFVAGVKFDFKPFGFIDENNQLDGFDIDIMREFAKRWLGDADAVDFVQVTSANRIDKLVANEVDIVAASMTHKRERDEAIDFSQTYFLDGQSLLVRRDSGIRGLEDLGGKTVAAIQGSTSIDNIQQAADELGIAISVLPFQEYPQALEALKAGQVDALTTDSVALSQFAKDNRDLEVVGGRFTSEPYGLGVPNYDDRFSDLVNFTLQEMKLDGAYDRLYKKWFGNDRPYAVEVWPGDSYLDVELTPMVKVAAGEFLRGNDGGFPDEQGEQEIYLDDFHIDQYEVTNRMYNECVQAGSCTLPRLPRSVNFANYYAETDFGNYPVIWVDWNDAANYCEFVGSGCRRRPSGRRLRVALRASSTRGAMKRPSDRRISTTSKRT